MLKDKIFFGESGLTTTSANHIANIAKEKYQLLLKQLETITLYNTNIGLIGSEKQPLSYGVETLSNVKPSLETIAQLKSLIAWLREAIKAKERLFEDVKSENFGLVAPIQPICENVMTEDEYVATWSIKKRNRYYFLETMCATIGSYIHPNGVFAKAREEYMNKLTNPLRVVGQGRDTTIYEYVPSVDSEEVENTFMTLQSEYRSYQSELNSLKYEIEEAIRSDNLAKSNKYSSEMRNYEASLENYNAEIKTLRLKENERISNLKIIIPDSLQKIYQEVKAD